MAKGRYGIEWFDTEEKRWAPLTNGFGEMPETTDRDTLTDYVYSLPGGYRYRVVRLASRPRARPVRLRDLGLTMATDGWDYPAYQRGVEVELRKE